MTCETFEIERDGEIVRGIVCHRGKKRLFCHCGKPAARECDWKLGKRTCDRPLCLEHTMQPAQGKDLCPEHAKIWATHPANKQATLPLSTA